MVCLLSAVGQVRSLWLSQLLYCISGVSARTTALTHWFWYMRLLIFQQQVCVIGASCSQGRCRGLGEGGGQQFPLRTGLRTNWCSVTSSEFCWPKESEGKPVVKGRGKRLHLLMGGAKMCLDKGRSKRLCGFFQSVTSGHNYFHMTGERTDREFIWYRVV